MPHVSSVSACAHSYVLSHKLPYNLSHLVFFTLSTSSINDTRELYVLQVSQSYNGICIDWSRDGFWFEMESRCIWIFLDHQMSWRWERARNLVKAPAFFGTGRGGEKEFKSFADFNLSGRSLNATMISGYAMSKCRKCLKAKSVFATPIFKGMWFLLSCLRSRNRPRGASATRTQLPP